MLSDFIIGHDHKFLNQSLTIHSFLDTDIDWVIFFIQLEANFISVKNLCVGSGLPFFKCYFLQRFNFLYHLVESLESYSLGFCKFFPISQSIVQHWLSLIISQSRWAFNYIFFESRGNDLSIFIEFEEHTEYQSLFMALKGTHFNNFFWHHMDCFVWQINWRSSFKDLISIDEVFICCHIRYMDADFISILTNKLQRESILDIDRVWRINCE